MSIRFNYVYYPVSRIDGPIALQCFGWYHFGRGKGSCRFPVFLRESTSYGIPCFVPNNCYASIDRHTQIVYVYMYTYTHMYVQKYVCMYVCAA